MFFSQVAELIDCLQGQSVCALLCVCRRGAAEDRVLDTQQRRPLSGSEQLLRGGRNQRSIVAFSSSAVITAMIMTPHRNLRTKCV